MTEAMKPCPFCNSSNLDYQTRTPDREGIPTNVICQDCGACGPWVYEKKGEVAEANEEWNKRAGLVSIIAELRHLYQNMVTEGAVKDTAAIAKGLLGPQIERLENL